MSFNRRYIIICLVAIATIATTIVLLLRVSHSSSLPLGEIKRPESGMGSVKRVELLDTLLQQKGDASITALVRVTETVTIEDVALMLSEAGSPAIVSFNAYVGEDTVVPHVRIGTTPIVEIFSREAARDAIEKFWNDDSVTQAIDGGEAFRVDQFTVTGTANGIREWWYANADQVLEVVVN